MYKNRAAAVAFCQALVPLLHTTEKADIVICAPFTQLDVLADALAGNTFLPFLAQYPMPFCPLELHSLLQSVLFPAVQSHLLQSNLQESAAFSPTALHA